MGVTPEEASTFKQFVCPNCVGGGGVVIRLVLLYRNSDSEEDCTSSRREWRNERTPMAPLWHECNAGAPTEQAGGDRGDPMAGPPVEPPSHHEEEEALMAAPEGPPLSYGACARRPSWQASDKKGDPYPAKSMEGGKLLAQVVQLHPETTSFAAGGDDRHSLPAPFPIVPRGRTS